MPWRTMFTTLSLLSAAGLLHAQGKGSALETPQTFGTAAGYTTTIGHELTGAGQFYFARYLGATFCVQGVVAPCEAFARIELPDGATLSQLQFWAYDTDPDWLTVRLYESCQAVGFNPPSTNAIASADTFGSIGTYFGFTPLNGHRVNNRDCSYAVAVLFNPGGTSTGGTLQIQKIHVSWFREVSPPPATATFDDVPTTHPLFQFVEALVKAGVTGGCGGGNFCPNAPLTRGQMAVFLSRALGLQWP